MKTAVLILAHHQPVQLKRLIDALNCDWIDCFIHIDQKSDIDTFKNLVPPSKSITYLESDLRVKVSWGGFSQVQATLNLLKVALSSEQYFDRFCLLSGSAFPIKSLSEIQANFDTEKEFMRVGRRFGKRDRHTHSNSVRRFYFFDIPILRIKGFSGLIPRKPYGKIMLYHGSQWWALTNKCVQYILDFIDKNPDYIRFHKYTRVPDEIFFHSIVKSSPFAKNLTQDIDREASPSDLLASNEHGHCYINWNIKSIARPKVLIEEDLKPLRQSQCLFA